MKLVLSRKGFDSSAGGFPSPILPGGRMVWLPIPDKNSVITYRDIQCDGESIGPMVEQLTHGRIPQTYRAHLDPDLVEGSRVRRPGWRPVFGQTNQAQTHLQKNGIGAGDLFLFFGLFRRTRRAAGRLAWERGERPGHVIWGWLQVDEVLSPNEADTRRYAWAIDHPHFYRGDDPQNTIYVARKQLDLGLDFSRDLPGAGVFPQYVSELQLTAEDGRNASDWKLPSWFFPHRGRTPLTYHAKPGRWENRGDHTRLSAVSRGQEFVLDCSEYPEAVVWFARLLGSCL